MAVQTRTFSVGDQLRVLSFALRNADGTPLDLTGSHLDFLMFPDGSATAKVYYSTIDVDDEPGGLAHYEWQTYDVDTPGIFWGYVRRTKGSGVEHMPQGKELQIVFTAITG